MLYAAGCWQTSMSFSLLLPIVQSSYGFGTNFIAKTVHLIRKSVVINLRDHEFTWTYQLCMLGVEGDPVSLFYIACCSVQTNE